MKRDAGKEQFWRKTMAEASGSGQSVRAFCRQRGLKELIPSVPGEWWGGEGALARRSPNFPTFTGKPLH